MHRRVSRDAEPSSLSGDELIALRPRQGWGQEAWVGLFVIIGVAAALLALFTLTDAADFRGRDIVRTTVADAGGLRNGDPVQMRGVNIGRVHGFDMTPAGVEIRLELEDDYAVPADSRVALRSNGLLGGRIVDVLPGASSARARDGDVLPSGDATYAGAASGGAPASIDALTDRATTVLAGAEALLSAENVGAARETALGMRDLVGELNAMVAAQRTEIATLTASLRRSAEGIEDVAAGPELDRALERLDAIGASLDRSTRTLEGAAASLSIVLARIENGEGTLGRLSRDAALYDNLNSASAELTTLLRDLREDPSRYLELSLF